MEDDAFVPRSREEDVAACAEYEHRQARNGWVREQVRQHGCVVYGGDATRAGVDAERIPLAQRHIPGERVGGSHRES